MLLPQCRVLLRVHLSFLGHLVDGVLAIPTLLILNNDLILHTRHFIHRRNLQDPVGIEIKRHNDLGHPRLRPLNPADDELAQQVVAVGRGTLPLVNAHVDLRLIVLERRKRVALAARDGRVALNNGRHDLPLRLDPQAEGGHIEQKKVCPRVPASRDSPRAHGACENRRLDRRAVSHGLIRVYAAAELLATEEV
mmetsp:Transcript_31404/g.76977  ORF Transcript_31404/g.76977 Transcript_31404/m.76977 type:complete len:194 (+) Transcript_31404:327-908(+)